MKKPIGYAIATILSAFALTGFAIDREYRGIVNLKFPGVEITVDGRSGELPESRPKLK